MNFREIVFIFGKMFSHAQHDQHDRLATPLIARETH